MKSRSPIGVVGSQTMEYIETPYQVKDYQMITKHLREKVHLEKLQGRRARKGRLGTTTSLQHRGLHNYPMQYNREDVRSAKWSPERRREKMVKTSLSKVDSTSNKQHSKDMFDFAVVNAPPKMDRSATVSVINVDKEKRRTRKSSVDSDISVISQSRTGPTRDGSIIYNNRAKVLNSIRVRPHTDTGCRYNHERASSQQNIREAMSAKSSMYDVLDLNQRRRIGSSSSCGSSTLFLIPRSHDRSQGSVYSDYLDADSNGNYRPSTVQEFLAEQDVFETTTNDGSFDDWNDRERRFSVGRRDSDCDHLLPPSTPCGVNLVTLNEESSSSSESEGEQEPKEPPPPPTPAASPKKGRAVLPEPEVVEEPPPPKLILKGPHCWVDDATVTSSHPDSEDIEAADNDIANPSGELHSDSKQELATNPTNTKTVPVKETVPTGVDIPDGVKCDHVLGTQEPVELNGVDDIHVEDTDSIDDNLPPFICPSSEKKSREAAIKDWLYSSNNLFVYPRSVPMV